jgi:hypothetical protein
MWKLMYEEECENYVLGGMWKLTYEQECEN